MQPESVNVSLGTAVVLGLADAPVACLPTTAYLMLGGRCRLDCAFCAQARDSRAGALQLSRVTWPEFPLWAVVERLRMTAGRGTLLRACLQVTASAAAPQEALAVLRAVKAVCEVPFDLAILPRDVDQVRALVRAGADHIGFGLDAACERIFRQVKGGRWERSLVLIEQTAQAFPGRAAVHLIAGLGETERELVERIQWAYDLGVTTGLFAFTPVPGTRLAKRPAPAVASYRRLQAAQWLIAHGESRLEKMQFEADGRLVGFGAALPHDGSPFRTSGCPDCNRPYYNERPGGTLYNYPRPLTPEEAARALAEVGQADEGRGSRDDR
ncbi:MAG TPA: radical SAM protein [Anaerolineae bacterium]|nr:radical SAM protein [Anaerolineae bacterium]